MANSKALVALTSAWPPHGKERTECRPIARRNLMCGVHADRGAQGRARPVAESSHRPSRPRCTACDALFILKKVHSVQCSSAALHHAALQCHVAAPRAAPDLIPPPQRGVPTAQMSTSPHLPSFLSQFLMPAQEKASRPGVPFCSCLPLDSIKPVTCASALDWSRVRLILGPVPHPCPSPSPRASPSSPRCSCSGTAHILAADRSVLIFSCQTV